jgi:hypothetical protein
MFQPPNTNASRANRTLSGDQWVVFAFKVDILSVVQLSFQRFDGALLGRLSKDALHQTAFSINMAKHFLNITIRWRM